MPVSQMTEIIFDMQLKKTEINLIIRDADDINSSEADVNAIFTK